VQGITITESDGGTEIRKIISIKLCFGFFIGSFLVAA